MTWNYRVVHRVYTNPDGTQCDQYAIHEAYYLDGESPDAVPSTLTAEPCEVRVDDLSELQDELERFQRAATMPVVEWSEVVDD